MSDSLNGACFTGPDPLHPSKQIFGHVDDDRGACVLARVFETSESDPIAIFHMLNQLRTSPYVGHLRILTLDALSKHRIERCAATLTGLTSPDPLGPGEEVELADR